MSQTRRLAAILAADVAGYSRLIGADEAGTLQAFKTIKAELFDPTIAAHNGRLVKTTGDLTLPDDAMSVVPPPLAKAKLLELHAVAGKLAEHAPAVIPRACARTRVDGGEVSRSRLLRPQVRCRGAPPLRCHRRCAPRAP